MKTSIAIAAFIILSGIVLLAAASMLRALLVSIRQRRDEAYVPVPDPNPPAPVMPRPAVSLVAGLTILYAAAHLLLLAYWMATHAYLEQSTTTLVVAAYVAAGAIILAIGGILLGSARAFGRRVIAWGGFLFGILSFMLGIIALLLPMQLEAPENLREAADGLLILAVVHLVIDTALGSAAQHVGKPTGAEHEPKPHEMA